MTIRFSVFIPIWNGGKWLPGAIESVLAQSHTNWELVIGDNASTDDTATVVERYPDPRIRYHYWSTHADIYENYNRTLQLCRYEWLQLLCADDRLDPRCMEAMAARIEEGSGRTTRLAMVVTAARRVGPDGGPADDMYYGYQGRVALPDGLLDARAWMHYAAARGVTPWNFGSVAIACDVLAEMGGFFRAEIGICSDVELALRVSAYGDVAYIDEPLLDYTISGDSDSHTRAIRSRTRGDPLTSMAAALLSGLRMHEERREVSKSERAAVYAAVARSHLQRAWQHRYLPGGRGRLEALLDVTRAATYSPSTVLSPKNLAYGLAAVLSPRWVLKSVRARVLKRRYSADRRAAFGHDVTAPDRTGPARTHKI